MIWHRFVFLLLPPGAGGCGEQDTRPMAGLSFLPPQG